MQQFTQIVASLIMLPFSNIITNPKKQFLTDLMNTQKRQLIHHYNLYTTASTIVFSPIRISFTPVSFFWLKLKLSRYPLSL